MVDNKGSPTDGLPKSMKGMALQVHWDSQLASYHPLLLSKCIEMSYHYIIDHVTSMLW